jgi:hypothetical protein
MDRRREAEDDAGAAVRCRKMRGIVGHKKMSGKAWTGKRKLAQKVWKMENGICQAWTMLNEKSRQEVREQRDAALRCGTPWKV